MRRSPQFDADASVRHTHDDHRHDEDDEEQVQLVRQLDRLVWPLRHAVVETRLNFPQVLHATKQCQSIDAFDWFACRTAAQ